MRMVTGYVSVDLTQLSARNGGEFPRQRVYETIDGRRRILPHFAGDMPSWGLRFGLGNKNLKPEDEQKIRDRISALVDYLQSLQEKPASP